MFGVDAIAAAVVAAVVIIADDLFSAAADILCAAFANDNGVYMADSGGCSLIFKHHCSAAATYSASQAGSLSVFVKHVMPVQGQRSLHLCSSILPRLLSLEMVNQHRFDCSRLSFQRTVTW